MTNEKLRAGPATAELCPQAELPSRLRKPNLNGVELSEYLMQKFGLKIAPATLAKLRSVGGGPKFFKTSCTALYPTGEADEWARVRLGGLRSSTSDVEV
jgi:hypothetical protein